MAKSMQTQTCHYRAAIANVVESNQKSYSNKSKDIVFKYAKWIALKLSVIKLLNYQK